MSGNQSETATGTIFDNAVRLAEWVRTESDWSSQSAPHHRAIDATATFLSSGPGEWVQGWEDFFRERMLETSNHSDACRLFLHWSRKKLRSSTEFVKNTAASYAEIHSGFRQYRRLDIALQLGAFILIQKPCCRLREIAWLIPGVGAGIPADGVIAYAAAWLARLANDRVDDFNCDCLSVGNAWLHQLGIYLLHFCQEANRPPSEALVDLLSLTAQPPTGSPKGGKASRLVSELRCPESPLFLHESPTSIAVGTLLCLELTGETDANRQKEFFRRIERAVAYYAHEVCSGRQPSARAIQEASGLSWRDASTVTNQNFFYRLVFEHQCRYILAKHHSDDCPECASLFAKFALSPTGKRLPSSV